MAAGRHNAPTTERAHFATLLVMALAPEEVGKRIADARKAKGWTHEEFSRQAGVNLRTVQRWQAGRNPKTGKSWLPRLGRLMDIADLLDVPKSYFVEEADGRPALNEVVERLEAAVSTLADEAERLASIADRLERGDPQAAGGRG